MVAFSIDPEQWSWVIVGSILGSILSVSYLVVITEFDIETSVHNLTNLGAVIGYLPVLETRKQVLVMLGIFLFVSGYIGVAIISLSVLSSASALITVLWCLCESLVLLTLRYRAEEGKWHITVAGADFSVGSGGSVVFEQSWLGYVLILCPRRLHQSSPVHVLRFVACRRVRCHSLALSPPTT